MADLQIRVGDLHFSARWEAAAPRTIEAIRRMLPIEREAHPLPLERRVDVDPVRRLPAGASTTRTTPRTRRPGQLAIYPGGISECEIFFPYGACTTASKVGQLAANHFATIVPDDGWARSAPRDRPALPLGRRPGHLDPGSRLMDGTSLLIVAVVGAIVLGALWAARGGRAWTGDRRDSDDPTSIAASRADG